MLALLIMMTIIIIMLLLTYFTRLYYIDATLIFFFLENKILSRNPIEMNIHSYSTVIVLKRSTIDHKLKYYQAFNITKYTSCTFIYYIIAFIIIVTYNYYLGFFLFIETGPYTTHNIILYNIIVTITSSTCFHNCHHHSLLLLGFWRNFFTCSASANIVSRPFSDLVLKMYYSAKIMLFVRVLLQCFPQKIILSKHYFFFVY